MSAVHAAASMQSLLNEFELGTLPPARFSHRLHLALGWQYLQRHGFPAGAALFCARLKEYVQAVGAAGKYHETITWAYLVLLNEELTQRAAPGEHFDSMIARRPDLLDHRQGALMRYYTAQQLETEVARNTFVLPDRGAN